MEERIRQALGHVQAEDALKEKTINAVTHRLYSRKKQMLSRKKSLMAVVACLVVMLIGGGWVYATPTATIGINNESTLILKTNRWGRVIFVDEIDEEGKTMEKTLSLTHCSYETAVRKILEDPLVAEKLDRGVELVVTVEGDDVVQCKEMIECMESCVSRYENARCHGGRWEDVVSGDGRGSGRGNGQGNGNRGQGYHGGK